MNNKITAKELRQQFFDFFKSKGHVYVHSSSTIPHNDPTLLFANAGMNQYKPIFQGTVDPNSELGRLKRAYNSQKCIRAGGKHNDLDDVGRDVYHHTFFEMLGNWSFGDYFKKEACEWAWELLTEVWKIPSERLYVTYFGGDISNGLPADEEARDIWISIGLPKDHVLPFGMKENFWEMGETGPCGPCSEIHYDRVGDRDAAHLVNQDDPDVLEIWNLVFIQFNRYSNITFKFEDTIIDHTKCNYVKNDLTSVREEGGSLKPLPAKHIDTGMGFERVLSVLQNKRSNYDTDLFVPLFKTIEAVSFVLNIRNSLVKNLVIYLELINCKLHDYREFLISLMNNTCREYSPLSKVYILGTNTRPYTGKVGVEDTDKIDMAYRVLADHARVLTIALGDGGRAQNTGRGYVIRRILRRAVRFAIEVLNAKPGFLATLVDVVIETLGNAFPEVTRDPDTIKELINEEEEQFLVTLKRGRRFLDRVIKDLKVSGSNSTTLSGEVAWGLYETYGFPLDLTQILAEEHHLKIDLNGYEKAKEEAQIRSQSRKCTGGSIMDLDVHALAELKSKNISVTDDSDKFVTEFSILDIQCRGGYILHIGTLHGKLNVGSRVLLSLDTVRRTALMRNHTGTHVLNFALRELVDESEQKGSLVAPDRLRFDFTAKRGMTRDELAKAEEICDTMISKRLNVYSSNVSLSYAKTIQGVRAVFGEAYPDPVRVVSIGVPVTSLVADPEKGYGKTTSVEFCGGTHVLNTKHIEVLVIVSEEAISKGVRRIIALTGHEAERAQKEALRLDNEVNELIQFVNKSISLSQNNNVTDDFNINRQISNLSELVSRAVISQHHRENLREKLFEAKKLLDAQEARLLGETLSNSPSNYIIHVFDAQSNTKILNSAIKEIERICPNKAVMVISSDLISKKLTVLCQVPKVLVSHGLKANEWVTHISKTMDGKGGGKESSAQAVGSRIDTLEEVIRLADIFASTKLTNN
ncbi:alanyl-tRNA synthetase [Schistosoma bovis]|uniref:alanine--tRNA ligase n=1 Tax=Schistosoma bovis TaxID=6184 RepID=A0A430QBS4_SCHBO|nr:alanyl-tRNA synthetase [Schistosoma bovis]